MSRPLPRHLRLAEPPEPLIEASVSVRRAANALDVDPSTVREMIRVGVLRAHRVGAKDRGVRVYVASIEEYRESREIRPQGGVARQRQARPKAGAAHREAMTYLRGLGIA